MNSIKSLSLLLALCAVVNSQQVLDPRVEAPKSKFDPYFETKLVDQSINYDSADILTMKAYH